MSSYAPAFVALKRRLSKGEKEQLEAEIRTIRESSLPPYRKAKQIKALYEKWIRVARGRKDAYRANQTSTNRQAKQLRANANKSRRRTRHLNKEFQNDSIEADS